MNRINCTFTFLLFLSIKTGFSQGLLPLLDPGNTWSCYGDFFFQNVKYRLGEDTLLAGRAYRKIMAHGSDIPFSFNPDSAVYKSCLREENGKVMVIEKGFMAEHILYDFNKQAGDTIRFYRPSGNMSQGVLPGYVTGKIYKTDQVTIFGIARKRLFIHDPFMVNQLPPQALNQLDPQADVWIEGIGSRTGLFQRMPGWGIVGPQPYLLACVENNGMQVYLNNTGYPADPADPCFITPEDNGPGEDTLVTSVYDEKADLILYPNPAASLVTIRNVPECSVVVMLASDGRITSPPAKPSSDNELALDVSSLSQGLYQLIVSCENGVFVKRLVINGEK